MDPEDNPTRDESDERSRGAKDDPAINVDKALAHAAGDRGILVSMAQLFLDEGPKQLRELAAEKQQGNLSGIRHAAHKLKGSLVIFGAARAVSAARSLEALADDADLGGMEDAWSVLNQEMMKLEQELAALCDQTMD